jgi:hypothetical protein
MDEIAEALTDLREEIARLPRWNDDHVSLLIPIERGWPTHVNAQRFRTRAPLRAVLAPLTFSE